jgi:hypothetical protein
MRRGWTVVRNGAGFVEKRIQAGHDSPRSLARLLLCSGLGSCPVEEETQSPEARFRAPVKHGRRKCPVMRRPHSNAGKIVTRSIGTVGGTGDSAVSIDRDEHRNLHRSTHAPSCAGRHTGQNLFRNGTSGVFMTQRASQLRYGRRRRLASHGHTRRLVC